MPCPQPPVSRYMEEIGFLTRPDRDEKLALLAARDACGRNMEYAYRPPPHVSTVSLIDIPGPYNKLLYTGNTVQLPGMNTGAWTVHLHQLRYGFGVQPRCS